MTTPVTEISVADAKAALDAADAVFLDIRDPGSYAAGHIPGAISVSEANVEEIVASGDKQQKLIVYCYHGNSSMGGASYFESRGFEDVVSMTGGFEHWRVTFPAAITED